MLNLYNHTYSMDLVILHQKVKPNNQGGDMCQSFNVDHV